jgi:integrase
MKRIATAPFVVVPPGGNARERWLTQEEVRQIIEGASELHVKLFIILSVTTAARPSHVLSLKWKAVDTEARIIDFRDLDTAANNKVRPRVPINATCLEHLTVARELARTEYVIEMNGRGGFARAYKGVVEAARRAGIKGVSPYVLRHTAGVWMAKARVPMQEIAAFMGHKDLKTTIKHYAHHHPDFLRGAANALEIV